VFTTTCPYCEASIPAWNRLSDLLAAEGTALLGISLDPEEETRTYRQQHGLRYPVIHFPHESLRRMYRGGWVPATMVVDGEGLILHARMGQVEIGPATDSVLEAVRWAPAAAARAAGAADTSLRAGAPPVRSNPQSRRE
jgi:peroxiredoxin